MKIYKMILSYTVCKEATHLQVYHCFFYAHSVDHTSGNPKVLFLYDKLNSMVYK